MMRIMRVEGIVLDFMKMPKVLNFWRNSGCHGVLAFFMLFDGDCGIFGCWVSFGESSLSMVQFYFLGRW
jgi:hypothetical protein